MNMKKSKKSRGKMNISDAVIKRGRDIYEKWVAEKFTSRRIVEFVACAASDARNDSAEAVSCLFALYTRIKNRYASSFSRIAFYFSLRREMHALKRLERALKLGDSAPSLREVLEIDLKTLAERIRIENIIDDVDDTAHGGKHTEKSGDAEPELEAKRLDELSDNNRDERLDFDEKGERADEKAEDLNTANVGEERKGSVANDQRVDNAPANNAYIDTAEIIESSDRSEAPQEQQPENLEFFEVKQENNAPNEISEHIIDTQGASPIQNTEVADKIQIGGDLQQNTSAVINNTDADGEVTLNTAVDTVRIPENKNVFGENNAQAVEDQISQKELDEKEYEDYIRFLQWKENSRSGSSEVESASHTPINDSVSNETPENKLPNHLFDSAHETVPQPVPDPVPDPVIEPIPDPVPNPLLNSKPVPNPVSAPADNPQGNKDVREPIRVDLMEGVDLETAIQINTNISLESAAHIYEYKASIMREHLEQLAAEFKMPDPVEIIGRPNLEDVYRQSGLALGV